MIIQAMSLKLDHPQSLLTIFATTLSYVLKTVIQHQIHFDSFVDDSAVEIVLNLYYFVLVFAPDYAQWDVVEKQRSFHLALISVNLGV